MSSSPIGLLIATAGDATVTSYQTCHYYSYIMLFKASSNIYTILSNSDMDSDVEVEEVLPAAFTGPSSSRSVPSTSETGQDQDATASQEAARETAK